MTCYSFPRNCILERKTVDTKVRLIKKKKEKKIKTVTKQNSWTHRN